LPEVDVAFAQSFGVASGNIDELKAEIETNLKLELKRKIETKVKEQALVALRRMSDLAIPRSLVEQESQNLMIRAVADLKQKGARSEDIKLSPDMFSASAEERVALGLVLAEVVRAN